MSNSVSNLYASKIFAEHPLALWALDDDIPFVSLLEEQYKDIQNTWIINPNKGSFVSFSENHIPRNRPLFEQPVSLITKNIASNLDIVIQSPSAAYFNSFTDLDIDKKSVSINIYAYSLTSIVNYYEIGFEYVDPSTGQTVFNSNRVSPGALGFWEKITHTASDIPFNVVVKPTIKVVYKNANSLDEEDYYVFFNGISLGQWSEVFHFESTGIFPIDLQEKNNSVEQGTAKKENLEQFIDYLNSASVNLNDLSLVEADSYGFNENNSGYYIVDKGKLLAINGGMPLIYGSKNVTQIFYSDNEKVPSLVIPGQGFLSEEGKYKNFTVEFWLRIDHYSNDPIKIFGNLDSKDGIYVDEEYITVNIGGYSKSHFIGKWYRPMLIDFCYSPEMIKLYINGENVIEFEIDIELINFSNNNMLGFFSNSFVYEYSLDCVAVYPYIVPKELIKKRYIYGQGVDLSENIVSKFVGENYYVDFTFSGYSNNLIYPDMISWQSGFYNNLNIKNKIITSLEYESPEILITPQSSSVVFDPDLLLDNYNLQNESVTFLNLVPANEYLEFNSSLFFNSLNYVEDTTSFIGIFKKPESLNSQETIAIFTNSSTNKNLQIVATENQIVYKFFDGLSESIIETYNVLNQKFLIGLNFKDFAKNYRSIIGNFFDNLQLLSLNIGNNLDSQFTGNVYSLTFNDDFLTRKDFQNLFTGKGTINAPVENALVFEDYIGSYTVSFSKTNESVSLDVGSKGYWEDSIPFTSFSKLVKGLDERNYNDLDLIQFNIDYPSSILKNPETSTDDVQLKTFITIQTFENVGKVPYSNYNNVVDLTSSKVLDFDNTIDVRKTKFQISDGTAIFPPKELVNFEDYYITIHLEISTRSINSKPFIINKMSLASLSIDESGPYQVKTKNGNDIYPFSRTSNIYNYKLKNPFTISKESVSYLYLSGDSGIRVLPYSSSYTRGIAYPINVNQREDYLFGGVQFWVLFDDSALVENEITIGSIRTIRTKYLINLVPEVGGRRGKLVLINERTKEEVNNFQFFQNGILVDNPYISPLTWSSIVISFGEEIPLANEIGIFEIYPGILINNVAIFEKTSEVVGQTIFPRFWDELLTEPETGIRATWGYWRSSNVQPESANTWKNVFEFLETLKYSLDGESLFRSYMGISNVVANDSTTLSLDSDSVSLTTDIIWSSDLYKPL
jgi:hypothetical protein